MECAEHKVSVYLFIDEKLAPFRTQASSPTNFTTVFLFPIHVPAANRSHICGAMRIKTRTTCCARCQIQTELLYVHSWSVHRTLDLDIKATKTWTETLQHHVWLTNYFHGAEAIMRN